DSGATIVAETTFTGGATIYCNDSSLALDNVAFVGDVLSPAAITGYYCGLSVRHSSVVGYFTAIRSVNAYFTQTIVDNTIVGGGITISGSGNYGGFTVGEVSGNRITTASGDGILISDEPYLPRLQLVVTNNVVVGSGEDGNHIVNNNGGSVTVGGNLALGNFALGINASSV